MKQLLSILLVCALLVGVLCSCKGGKREEDTTAPAPVEVVTTPPAITLGDGTDYSSLLNSALDFTRDDEGFTYTVNGNEVTVTGYRGEKKRICIPETLEGKTVTAIDEGAFAGEKQLTAVSIPTTVKRIGDGILTGCTSLEVLQTPLMGAEPNAVQYLGYLFGADRHADNPKDVPASLKYLSLVGMSSLADYALFDCNDLVAIQMDSVTAVGKYALYHCASLKYVSSVSQLTSVSDFAFDSCSALLRLDFGNGLSKMGFGALQGCAALQELTLPFVGASLTENNYIGYVFGATVPDFTAGFYPASLASVILTDACTVLGDYAFYECSSLKRIALPETLTAVGARAFSGCSRLFEVALGGNVKTIGASAFSGCTSLHRLNLSEGLEQMDINTFYGCRSLCELVLPQSLKALPASAFAECVSLKTVSLGGVQSVGANAFYLCVRLEQMTANGEVNFEKGNEYAKNAMGLKD